MKQKPIELMHCYYDTSDGNSCGSCCNLREYKYNSKRVRKCIAYGGLHSSKADWAKRWLACGLYGKAVPGQMVSDTAKAMFSRIGVAKTEPNCDGQMSIEELKDGTAD